MIEGELGRDQLQRHAAAELEIDGLIDDSHPSATDRPLKPYPATTEPVKDSATKAFYRVPAWAATQRRQTYIREWRLRGSPWPRRHVRGLGQKILLV